jgi:hypothetical protein
MTNYKFDGQQLKYRSKTIANTRGDNICEGSGTSVVCNLRGDNICKGRGTTVEFNLRGDKICKGRGTSKIADLDDAEDAIDGPGRVVLAALWLYFVR